MDADADYNEIMNSDLSDGSIILMHDIHEPSVKCATEKLIPELVNEGYKLVTVSELAAAKDVTLQSASYSDFWDSSFRQDVLPVMRETPVIQQTAVILLTEVQLLMTALLQTVPPQIVQTSVMVPQTVQSVTDRTVLLMEVVMDQMVPQTEAVTDRMVLPTETMMMEATMTEAMMMAPMTMVPMMTEVKNTKE